MYATICPGCGYWQLFTADGDHPSACAVCGVATRTVDVKGRESELYRNLGHVGERGATRILCIECGKTVERVPNTAEPCVHSYQLVATASEDKRGTCRVCSTCGHVAWEEEIRRVS